MLAANPSGKNLLRLLRLWAIVFAANLTGTLIAALFSTFAPVPLPGIRETILEISHHAVAHGFFDSILASLRGVRGKRTISIRRFFLRPSGVELLATG